MSVILRRLTGIDDEEDGMEKPENQSDEQAKPDPADVELPEDMPGAVDEADAREAIAVALELIQNEPMSFSVIAEEVSRQHDLGYGAAAEKRDGSWWKRVVKPGIKANGAEHQRGRGWSV